MSCRLFLAPSAVSSFGGMSGRPRQHRLQHEQTRGGLAAFKVISPYGGPNKDEDWPSDGQLFDLLEFLYEHAGLPKAYSYHSFFGHDHLSYDQEAGRAKFVQKINRFFERNGLAFEVKHGEVTRMSPTGR